MKDLKLQLFQITKNSTVFEMKAREVAQLIIEHVLVDENGGISDSFMELMAYHLHKFKDVNHYVWKLFAEIAMQRISIGAMQGCGIKHADWTNNYGVPSSFSVDISKNPHKGKVSFKPEKVYNFTSMVKPQTPLNKACVTFLSMQGRSILCNSTKNHMRDILFALINDLADSGSYKTILVEDNVCKIELITYAKTVLYSTLPKDIILEEIAKKDIWYHHLSFIKDNWLIIDKKAFVKAAEIRGPFKVVRLFLKTFF